MMLGMWKFAHLSHPTGSIYKPPTIYEATLLNRVPSFLLTPLEFVFFFFVPIGQCSSAGAPTVFLDPHVLYLEASMTTE